MPDAGDPGFGEKTVIPHKPHVQWRFGAVSVHLGVEQKPLNAARLPAFSLCGLIHPFSHGAQLCILQEEPNHQEKLKIGLRKHFTAIILACGVVCKHRLIGLYVGVHHLKVRLGRLQERHVACRQIQADHLIIIDLIVVARGTLRKLAVLIDIEPFIQVLVSAP